MKTRIYLSKEIVKKERKISVNFLEDKMIQTRQYFGGNIMLNPGYTHLMDSEKVVKEYPVARKVTTDTFFLGTSPVLGEEKINYVGDMVDEFMGRFK